MRILNVCAVSEIGITGNHTIPFTLYLPPGFGSLKNPPIPHGEETSDPAKMFTAVFQNDAEIW
ncbi:MAG: hypothetical protein KBG16_01545 [Methanospirillum sp.]|nr:hypothetical protein [Methanospirillum sp.]